MSAQQHDIDLLPEAMRARTQARLQASRNIGIGGAALVILVAAITHARLLHDQREAQLQQLSTQAEALDQVDRQRQMLQEGLDRYASLTERYAAVENPLPLSRLLATIIEEMPPSVSLDGIILDADQTKRARSTRSAAPRKDAAEAPPRILVGELSGFAATDFDIAQFVSDLERRPPLSGVSLDFSRQRDVHGHSAREFRLSFTIDLDATYDIHDSDRDPERDIGLHPDRRRDATGAGAAALTGVNTDAH